MNIRSLVLSVILISLNLDSLADDGPTKRWSYVSSFLESEGLLKAEDKPAAIQRELLDSWSEWTLGEIEAFVSNRSLECLIRPITVRRNSHLTILFVFPWEENSVSYTFGIEASSKNVSKITFIKSFDETIMLEMLLLGTARIGKE